MRVSTMIRISPQANPRWRPVPGDIWAGLAMLSTGPRNGVPPSGAVFMSLTLIAIDYGERDCQWRLMPIAALPRQENKRCRPV
jgi:hypothetical protein